MRFCFCNNPVFGTDKNTNIGYCKSHQTMRTDVDKRTIMQKAIAKGKKEKQQVRSLGTFQKEKGIVNSIQELIIDLDRVVSRYVRLAAMGKDHKCDCYTCSTRRDWKKMHLGHYINRQHLGLRWENMNNKVQCPTCNITLRGNLEVYAKNLEKEQKGIVDWLEGEAHMISKPTKDELKQLLFHFQQKLKLVETKLK